MRPVPALRRAAALGVVLLLGTVSCTGDASGPRSVPSGDGALPAGQAADALDASVPQRPLVVTVPSAAGAAWLDPDADPLTPAGEARARHLPRWTPDLDGAFPPAVCGSAWELDAIAVPMPGADLRPYGEPTAMAALGVMRYEHLVSRAMAAPSVLAQLCVAVAAVDPARRDALAELVLLIDREAPAGTETVPGGESRIDGGESLDAGPDPSDRPGGAAAFPDPVVIVALSPSAALAAACVPLVHDSSDMSADEMPAVLRAYELVPARGIEDAVTDVSYRVARIVEQPAAGCTGFAAWAAEWEQQVQAWIEQGQAWLLVGAAVTADALCGAQEATGSEDCPAAWGSSA